MYENKMSSMGIRYSRYIASWNNVGGPDEQKPFVEWLRLEGLDDDEIADIIEMSMCGKMELENSAAQFLKSEGYTVNPRFQ